MKRINIYISIILLLAVSSCDYLDVVPDNITVLDNAFSSKYTAEQYLATCYWHLPGATMDNNPAMLGSGEGLLNNERDAKGSVIAKGLNNAANPAINYWSGTNSGKNLYNGIRDCNTFLENIYKVDDMTEKEKNRWRAEVKTLKAYYHFYLLRYYGPIQIMKENIPVFEDETKMRIERNSVDESFEYIIQLLDEAIDSEALPGKIENTQTEMGRITLPISLALKARVSMFYASPLFNGNTDYVSFVNASGEPFFNQTDDPKRWTDAVAACEAAIKVCNQYGIRLYQQSDYITSYNITDTTKLNCTLRNAFSERWNCETIWGNTMAVYGADMQKMSQAALQFTLGLTNPWYGVSINTVENFYSNKGIPIDEDISYDYTNRYKLRTATEDEQYYIERGQETAILNFDREPRFYAFLAFDRGKWYGRGKLENDATTWHVQAKANEYGAPYYGGWYSASGYWPKKLVSLKSGYEGSTRYTVEDYPFPELRYADLLLYYAEALNESKAAPDEQVFATIDEIRKRAGLEGVRESWRKYSKNPEKPATKYGMREIIHQEREIELAFENAHYWDMRRWKKGVSELNRPINVWNVLTDNNSDYYTIKVYFNQKFAQRDYLAPIPEAEIINNPSLAQNPGW